MNREEKSEIIKALALADDHKLFKVVDLLIENLIEETPTKILVEQKPIVLQDDEMDTDDYLKECFQNGNKIGYIKFFS